MSEHCGMAWHGVLLPRILGGFVFVSDKLKGKLGLNTAGTLSSSLVYVSFLLY